MAVSSVGNLTVALPVEAVAGECFPPTEDGSGGAVLDDAVKTEVGIALPSKRKEAGGELKQCSQVQHITRRHFSFTLVVCVPLVLRVHRPVCGYSGWCIARFISSADTKQPWSAAALI